MAEQNIFTREELSRHNGKEEPTVYFAYQGVVYDASGSKLWKTGQHMRRHESGADLTADLSAAPHGADVLERVPRVGTLRPEKEPSEENLPPFLASLLERYPKLRRHPHPMTVHFPLAYTLAIPLFYVLFLATGRAAFEATAFYLIALDIPSTAVGMVTGPYAWWVNYGAKLSFNIKVKMSFSAILMTLLLVLFFWRIGDPRLLFGSSGARTGFLALSFLLPFVVGVLGWIGAKMTFPH
ncbi:MAG: DUF2231 domain-containing protein [bacterium]